MMRFISKSLIIFLFSFFSLSIFAQSLSVGLMSEKIEANTSADLFAKLAKFRAYQLYDQSACSQGALPLANNTQPYRNLRRKEFVYALGRQVGFHISRATKNCYAYFSAKKRDDFLSEIDPKNFNAQNGVGLVDRAQLVFNKANNIAHKMHYAMFLGNPKANYLPVGNITPAASAYLRNFDPQQVTVLNMSYQISKDTPISDIPFNAFTRIDVSFPELSRDKIENIFKAAAKKPQLKLKLLTNFFNRSASEAELMSLDGMLSHKALSSIKIADLECLVSTPKSFAALKSILAQHKISTLNIYNKKVSAGLVAFLAKKLKDGSVAQVNLNAELISEEDIRQIIRTDPELLKHFRLSKVKFKDFSKASIQSVAQAIELSNDKAETSFIFDAHTARSTAELSNLITGIYKSFQANPHSAADVVINNFTMDEYQKLSPSVKKEFDKCIACGQCEPVILAKRKADFSGIHAIIDRIAFVKVDSARFSPASVKIKYNLMEESDYTLADVKDSMLGIQDLLFKAGRDKAKDGFFMAVSPEVLMSRDAFLKDKNTLLIPKLYGRYAPTYPANIIPLSKVIVSGQITSDPGSSQPIQEIQVKK